MIDTESPPFNEKAFVTEVLWAMQQLNEKTFTPHDVRVALSRILKVHTGECSTYVVWVSLYLLCGQYAKRPTKHGEKRIRRCIRLCCIHLMNHAHTHQYRQRFNPKNHPKRG